MSSLSGASGASSPWSSMGGSSVSRQERMFAKIDSNGDGSVDKAELQTAFDAIAQKTGGTAKSADALFGKFDTDGDGKLSASELSTGMKSLRPKPTSTVEMAGAQAKPAAGGPAGGGSSSGATSASTDPLDTNGDGVVSALERAAGDLKAMLASLASAMQPSADSVQAGAAQSALSLIA